MMWMELDNAVRLAHNFIEKVLTRGGRAVDATAGNGNDTVFLASGIGEKGMVYAFDIQDAALAETKKKLEAAGFLDRVRLIKAGHEEMGKYVEGPVDAVMFNLGYLPGSDHSVITKPETTVEAVKAGLDLLKTGGLMSIAVYYGHPGGEKEKEAVLEFLTRLDGKRFAVIKIDYPNRKNNPPFLILIEKRGEFSHEKQAAK